MIKVIAADMDGTLLADNRRISPETFAAVHHAQEEGIRFMVVTGRNFKGAAEELDHVELNCDYIVSSGAEIRNPKREIVEQMAIDMDLCESIYEILKKYPLSVVFTTDECDYAIGTPEEIEEGFILSLQLFFLDMPKEEIVKTGFYKEMKAGTKPVESFQKLKEMHVPIYKIFLFAEDAQLLASIGKEVAEDERVAVASSFPNNLEITDTRAQKGPVLKAYIESLGYTMDEVMVFGDSMNDYSMLSMDFGATVAMANAAPEIKAVCKYETKSNEEHGVAWAIEEMLKKQKTL